MPGEISLAHKGVLFLDEIPEFASNTLQVLRQPIEQKLVRLVRADGVYEFPSDFLLIAAANVILLSLILIHSTECLQKPSISAIFRLLLIAVSEALWELVIESRTHLMGVCIKVNDSYSIVY